MSLPASGLTMMPTADTPTLMPVRHSIRPRAGNDVADPRCDVGRRREVVLLERRAERHRRERRADAADRRVEVVERLLLDLGGDLGAEPAEAHGLVDDDDPVGLAHRLDDGVGVERLQRARVDHLDVDAVAGQLSRPRRAPR